MKVSTVRGAGRTIAHRADPEAYSLYLQGRHSWHQLNPPALRRAIEYFEQAIQRDGSYAPAHVGLADAYYFLGLFESLAPREAYEKGAPAARRALDLDPHLAEAHAAAGNFKFSYEWDWAGAERHYQRAIELNPNSSLIRWHYGIYLGNLGRFDESLKQLEMGRSLDPLWVAPHQSLGYFSFVEGRYEESAAHHQAALRLDPHYPLALVTSAFLQLHFGRGEEALADARRAVAVTGGTSVYAGFLGAMCAMSGRSQEAIDIARDIERRGLTAYVSRSALAWVYTALGQTERALECLGAAYEQRDSMLLSLPVFPVWDPIRNSDGFRNIFDRMKFPLAGRGPRVAP